MQLVDPNNGPKLGFRLNERYVLYGTTPFEPDDQQNRNKTIRKNQNKEIKGGVTLDDKYLSIHVGCDRASIKFGIRI